MNCNNIGKVILGTVQLGISYGINNKGGKPDLKSAFDILNLAKEVGIKELDTAAGYGDSEEIIGNWNKKNGPYFRIMSKSTDLTNSNIERKVSESCEKLGLNSIEGYYFHRFSEFREMMGTESFAKMKSSGLIVKLGVSLYDLDDLRLAATHPAVDVIQLPWNILDCSIEKRRLLEQARDQGKQIYSRSVFLQGLFFMNPEQLPFRLQSLKEPLLKIQAIARDLNVSVDELALHYVLNSKVIDKVLIGVETAKQLELNIQALQKPISRSAIEEIEEIRIENVSLLNPANWGV